MGTGRLAELLLKTGAYKDLDQPTILASGELGIYFVNAEKLAKDGGAWEQPEFAEDPVAMAAHMVRMTKEHPEFREAVDILVETVKPLIPLSVPVAMSGGQRRDWIFSAPVAHYLGIPHVALFKQKPGEPDKIVVHYDGRVLDFSIDGWRTVHAVDLITEGSSVYRDEHGSKGWLPMLNAAGAQMHDLVAVVSRQQGGEHMLQKHGVRVHALETINSKFLAEHSKDKDRAVAYFRNPQAWSQQWLAENGALSFVSDFNPQGKRTDKARAFIGRYEGFLRHVDRFEELAATVKNNYGIDIAGGKS